MLLAQKAFSNYDCYRFFEPYLAGTEASGLFEARLGAEEMPGKEVHVFCAGYRADEFEELLQYADHMVFNSPSSASSFWKNGKSSWKECWDFGSTRNALPRKDMRFMIPAHQEAVWVPQGHSGMKQL